MAAEVGAAQRKDQHLGKNLFKNPSEKEKENNYHKRTTEVATTRGIRGEKGDGLQEKFTPRLKLERKLIRHK